MNRSIKLIGATLALTLVGAVAYLSRPINESAFASAGAPLGPTVSRAPSVPAQVHAMPSSAFAGLEQCEQSRELFELQNRMMENSPPHQKGESVRTYRVTGEFLGLKVSQMEIGVCELTGTRDCGWGSYVGLIVELPFEVVQQTLKSSHGIDFAEAKRDDEVEATMRPLLTRDESRNFSRLHCDPGTL